MANDNKFTEDELKQINTIADTYSALQPELGLTDAQVDDLFQQASQIS